MSKRKESNLFGIKVLLLEGFARQVMPMMEYLHKNGCHITTYNKSRLDMGYASHYPDKKLLKYWNRDDEEESYKALLEVLKENHYDVLIPLTDFSATMLSKHKMELKQYTNPAVNDWEVFKMAGDKLNTMMACQRNEIPCPKTIDDAKTADEVIASGIDFPFIIKPRVGYGSIGFHVINNEDELRNIYDECIQRFGGMVVQEYIPQTGIQYKCEVFIDSNGNVKAAHVFDKTRWYPIDGGSTCCSTAVKRPDIVDNCVKLLSAIGWKGYGDVDLIEDPRDGVCKVMEINPRITASVKVCFKSGVDFARQIVEFETGKEVTDFREYKAGNTLRYMHTDLLWFFESKNRFKTKPSWFSWKKTCDQIWSIKDPWPWFTYTIQGFCKFGKEKKKRKR